jgi:hypothetical protein
VSGSEYRIDHAAARQTGRYRLQFHHDLQIFFKIRIMVYTRHGGQTYAVKKETHVVAECAFQSCMLGTEQKQASNFENKKLTISLPQLGGAHRVVGHP